MFFIISMTVYAQNVSLDKAIELSAREIEDSLPRGAVIAVLNFTSLNPQFSEYIVNELMGQLVKNRRISVVARDRVSRELIQQEVNFQISGNVSDISAQSIGRNLGAQFFVSGSVIEDREKYYRIRFRVVEVETLIVQAMPANNVKRNDPKLGISLMNIAFGLGSYIERDWLGGAVVTCGHIASISLILWELNLDYEDNLAGYLAPAGIGVGSLSLLFGFVRPYVYKRNPQLAGITDNFTISIVPTKNNNIAASVLFSMEF